MMTPSPTPVAALQDVLRSEHAAVYGYGLLGPQLTGTGRSDALSALDHHRLRRDGIRAMITAAGAVPPEAEAAYRPGIPLNSPSAAVELAARIEGDLALAYGRLVAATTDDTRASAARWLQDAAVRQARWGNTAPRFPGLEAAPTPSAIPTATP
jgi:hypothetical protein